ncbi:hypothetical protein H4684_003302 [Desulfomicrobium macestii]|uniref:CRISPR type III-associated protein domain-containing protein n=1 Tax=Desulfomicrobium macestii TaxID=90731 RepID=A0ABR9H7D7_9BACT|nr:RAMP superfamily CRISPR-associated protein [Desulfomicrobium macestii]MBE1426636.1 hypothetical protein [Desulfomicrobium macestii]
MSTINFTIKLTSDGEPACGLGTSLTDSLLPRDVERNVIIPASHLKGLMRENLENLVDEFIPETILDTLFGAEGLSGGALFHLDDAVADKASVIDISRTALNEFGTADQGSLRTSEAVSTGTEFKGSIHFRTGLTDEYVQLLKLGLLSIFAVGGNRNRGAGACFVSIPAENKTPGQILRTLAKVTDWKSIPAFHPQKIQLRTDSNRPVMLKLVFRAQNPICVPETPIIQNNMIKSGFTIPASAVQGAILHRLNNVSTEVATACYEDVNFRAWPLNPTDSEGSLSIKVSFTHKLSKLTDNQGMFHFEDEMIRPYEWDKIPPNSPLKSADGALLYNSGKVRLWKSSDMPRVITAHGVINGDRKGGQKRNLYTIEAMAPMTFTGIVSMPESAAELLKQSLEDNPFVTLGKSRSVRGGGLLSAYSMPMESIDLFKRPANIFIVQSPLLVPDDEMNKPFAQIIKKLAHEHGFGEVEDSSGAISTLFGWNSTVHKGLLGAVAVINTGSVFRVSKPVTELEKILVAGVGKGRERGLGAVMPHPGIAEALFPDPPRPKKMKKIKNFAQEGFALWEKAKASQLSASQISRVRELTRLNSKNALAYLERQRTDRPESIWQRWKDVVLEMEKGISADAAYYCQVLKVCQDLLVADKGE